MRLLQDSARGHEIYSGEGGWFYADDDTPVVAGPRDCAHCGLPTSPEGHDGCIADLPGVLNACCGHGDPGRAYVQFADRRVVRYFSAVEAAPA